MKLGKHNKQISDLSKTADVVAIYLFGSRALGLEHSLSDYDYAVLTSHNNHNKGDKLYHRLYQILSDISPRTKKNDVIDLVYLQSVGLELKMHIIRYGKLIVDNDPVKRLEFEVHTQRLYCDFKPLLDTFDSAILESL